MVIKNDPRKVLDLMGTKHREADPDDEFLDRLARKTSFYDQPSAPPEALNLPPPPGAADAAAAALDELADVKLDDSEQDEVAQEGAALPPVVQASEPPPDAQAAAAAARQRAEHEKKEARYAALFEGRSAGGSEQGSVPEGLSFSRISVTAQPALPEVGRPQVTTEEAEAAAEEAAEEAARREAWKELNRLREERGQGSAVYRAAHDRFVATWGHRGAELRE